MKVLIEHAGDDGAKKDTVKVQLRGSDFWDMDTTLARVIYPMVKKYRDFYDTNKPMGYPYEFSNHAHGEEGDEDDKRLREWLAILDKIVYAFEAIAKVKTLELIDEKEFKKRKKELLKPFRKELHPLKWKNMFLERYHREHELIPEFFEEYYAALDAHRARIQEGTELFGKYFQNFWL